MYYHIYIVSTVILITMLIYILIAVTIITIIFAPVIVITFLLTTDAINLIFASAPFALFSCTPSPCQPSL